MRKVYTYMVMDILHRGHQQQLDNARAVAGPGGLVILGILTDKAVMEKKPRPMLTFDERFALARQLRQVDMVVAQETYSPLPNAGSMKVDVLMECAAHSEEAIEEAWEAMKYSGGTVIVTPYYPGVSSTEIKNRIKGDN